MCTPRLPFKDARDGEHKPANTRHLVLLSGYPIWSELQFPTDGGILPRSSMAKARVCSAAMSMMARAGGSKRRPP